MRWESYSSFRLSFDGEVLPVDEEGVPRFQLLQRLQKQPTPNPVPLFDILRHKAKTVSRNHSRKEKRTRADLESRRPDQLGNDVETKERRCSNSPKKAMEGIIATRKDSIFRPGKRTSDWLKIKACLQQEFVVGGFTAPKGSRKHLSAMRLGAFTKGKLRHCGYVDSGLPKRTEGGR
jgi:bifunctional non-homologous end joining protein LigD